MSSSLRMVLVENGLGRPIMSGGLRLSQGLLTLGLCLALLAGFAPVVHADPIFSFSDSPSPTPITSGNSTITLTGQSGSGQDAGFPGGANEFILNINLASTTTSPSSDSFNTSINFPLTITDTASLTSNIINFAGTLSGNLNNTSSSVFLLSITPTSPITFDLGGNSYTVSINPYSQPLTLGNNQISVNVQGQALSSSVPEPNSLALWGIIGMVGLGFGCRNLRERLAA
jgi:hypothetical protein